jgi:hypothetical protein
MADVQFSPQAQRDLREIVETLAGIAGLPTFASVRSGLALQLPFCFEVGAPCDCLVSSAPERPCDDVCWLDPLSSEPDGDASNFLD